MTGIAPNGDTTHRSFGAKDNYALSGKKVCPKKLT